MLMRMIQKKKEIVQKAVKLSNTTELVMEGNPIFNFVVQESSLCYTAISSTCPFCK